MTRKLLVSAFLILAVALSISAAPSPAATLTLTISGMHCEGCADGIKAMLKRTEGVTKADVSFDDKRAVVEYDPAMTSPTKIIEAIEKLGYKATTKK